MVSVLAVGPASALAPVSTLIPGMEPAAFMMSTSGVPSLAFWRIVSSYRMTPEMCDFIASVERNSISR